MKLVCVSLLGLCLALLTGSTVGAQARVTVVNQSQRQMTVKVMKASDSADVLRNTVIIGPRSSLTVLLYETGDYFLKTMAVLAGAEPLYQKGRPFRVYVGNDGVSVITMTFSIVESVAPQVAGGQQISKREFDQDSSPH